MKVVSIIDKFLTHSTPVALQCLIQRYKLTVFADRKKMMKVMRIFIKRGLVDSIHGQLIQSFITL